MIVSYAQENGCKQINVVCTNVMSVIARKYKMTVSSTKAKSVVMCTEGKNCDK
jgi:phosphopantetheine adenylyltransferase